MFTTRERFLSKCQGLVWLLWSGEDTLVGTFLPAGRASDDTSLSLLRPTGRQTNKRLSKYGEIGRYIDETRPEPLHSSTLIRPVRRPLEVLLPVFFRSGHLPRKVGLRTWVWTTKWGVSYPVRGPRTSGDRITIPLEVWMNVTESWP